MIVHTVKVILLITLSMLAQAKVKAQSAPLDTYSHLDTVQAVKRLFATKRTASEVYLGVGLPVTLIGAGSAFLVTTLASTIKLGKGNSAPIILASSGVGLVPTGIGLVRYIRFSRSKEQAILDVYQENRRVPKRIERQLKPKYFW
ncbi:hypothetical protein M0L20_18225 [Spirosoma sp. RP8]|uniref:Uncharacterized protein n=1 Tax=Spirosoma liriopis TaxID=2937440 RepID=A0ABT0HNR4_9BACT|nr:hypothetical protein [Spirosoma liriopis]MCK8493809.1 hypothetical protein [Spirosoma liriopis]